MLWYPRQCCCPPAKGAEFVIGSTPGPTWDVVTGTMPAVSALSSTVAHLISTNAPMLAIKREPYCEPWQLVGANFEVANPEVESFGGRVAVNYNGSSFNYIDVKHDYRDQDSSGCTVAAFEVTYWSKVFAQIGSSFKTFGFKSTQPHALGNNISISACVHEDGYIIFTYGEYSAPGYQFAMEFDPADADARAGFGLYDTSLHSYATNWIARPKVTDEDGDCPRCEVDEDQLAARFQGYSPPDEIAVVIPSASNSAYHAFNNCSCFAGTYYLENRGHQGYALEFSLDCDYGYSENDCAGNSEQPTTTIWRAILTYSCSGGSPGKFTLSVQRIRGGYPIDPNAYVWASSDIGTNIDPDSFSINLTFVEQFDIECTMTSAATATNA